jgi:hypothetical protein
VAVSIAACLFRVSTVSLNEQRSSGPPVILHRLCGAGAYGLPGTLCQPCPKVRACPTSRRHMPASGVEPGWPGYVALTLLPCVDGLVQNAECVGLFPLPVARPGFYPVSFGVFASCVPAVACPGVDTESIAESFSRPAARGLLRYGSRPQWGEVHAAISV